MTPFLIILGVLIVVCFFLHWFRHEWFWEKNGRGAPNLEEYIPKDKFEFVKRFPENGAELWHLPFGIYSPENLPETALFVLGANASVHHKTQYCLAKAFQEVGFDMYLLNFSSVCSEEVPVEGNRWQQDILSAYVYLSSKSPCIITRSLSCHLVTQLVMNKLIEPKNIAMITPVMDVTNFAVGCCTRQCCSPCCVAKLPLSTRCVIYYYAADFFMHPLCGQHQANIQYCCLPNIPDEQGNIHCKGPILHRDFIARHWARFLGLF